jgi:hypothetical protein
VYISYGVLWGDLYLYLYLGIEQKMFLSGKQSNHGVTEEMGERQGTHYFEGTS